MLKRLISYYCALPLILSCCSWILYAAQDRLIDIQNPTGKIYYKNFDIEKSDIIDSTIYSFDESFEPYLPDLVGLGFKMLPLDSEEDFQKMKVGDFYVTASFKFVSNSTRFHQYMNAVQIKKVIPIEDLTEEKDEPDNAKAKKSEISGEDGFRFEVVFAAAGSEEYLHSLISYLKRNEEIATLKHKKKHFVSQITRRFPFQEKIFLEPLPFPKRENLFAKLAPHIKNSKPCLTPDWL